MIFLRDKKKKRKKNKRESNVASNLFSVLTLSSLLVIVFIFHLFLYKQIESLDREKLSSINRIEELKADIADYAIGYKQKFDQYEQAIADAFYGKNQWKRQSVIKKKITID